MYPRRSGPALTSERARELDDAFFTSDPHGYFRGRIAALLRPRPEEPTQDVSPVAHCAFGRPMRAEELCDIRMRADLAREAPR